jgi:pimeloyl-ACP methyl ester carboxylesterase
MPAIPRTPLLALALALALAGGAFAAAPAPLAAQTAPAAHVASAADVADGWRDRAPHRAGFVTVAPGVRLHVLDYGGRGTPLVFLAGLGNTAHTWDDFAPRFTDRFHVVAITRRGFGESSHPAGGYTVPALAEDVRAALDSLHFDRVVLVGHSFGGLEMTELATRHPERVARLVYLDAAYDYAGMDSVKAVVFPTPPNRPHHPEPGAADTASPAALVAWVHRTRGVNIAEADIRTQLAYDGAREDATPAVAAIVETIDAVRPRFAALRAPALGVFAEQDSVAQMEPWFGADTARRAELQAMLDRGLPIDRYAQEHFRTAAPGNRVLVVPGGHHFVFVSHEPVVERAMRAFLAGR